MNADEAAAAAPGLPFCFPFAYVADSIPGGLETIIVLASLSGDDQARAVTGRSNSLSRMAKQSVELEELCRVVGIDAGHFFGTVTARLRGAEAALPSDGSFRG